MTIALAIGIAIAAYILVQIMCQSMKHRYGDTGHVVAISLSILSGIVLLYLGLTM